MQSWTLGCLILGVVPTSNYRVGHNFGSQSYGQNAASNTAPRTSLLGKCGQSRHMGEGQRESEGTAHTSDITAYSPSVDPTFPHSPFSYNNNIPTHHIPATCSYSPAASHSTYHFPNLPQPAIISIIKHNLQMADSITPSKQETFAPEPATHSSHPITAPQPPSSTATATRQPFPAPKCVLISNDDGPPGPHSPFIVPFLDTLKKRLGWDYKYVGAAEVSTSIHYSWHVAAK